jgi:hypothetical protein
VGVERDMTISGKGFCFHRLDVLGLLWG